MIRHQPITILAAAVSIVLLLTRSKKYNPSIISVTAFVPQALPWTNDIASRGSSNGRQQNNGCPSLLPVDGGCKWGLTSLHAAKSKSGAFL
jgi:hypothetical protein